IWWEARSDCRPALSTLDEKRRWRRAISVQLMNLQRPAAGVEHQQADARTVPQPLAGVSAVGQARHHLQLPTLGQPVEWRPRRVEPAVEAIEPVQQAPLEFVLHSAAGDLPELRTAVAGAD